MKISKELFQKMFSDINAILATQQLSTVSNNRLCKSLCANRSTAKYVRKWYPNPIAVYRIIFDHFSGKDIFWENQYNEVFRVTGTINRTKNRWKEFKRNMQISE